MQIEFSVINFYSNAFKKYEINVKDIFGMITIYKPKEHSPKETFSCYVGSF